MEIINTIKKMVERREITGYKCDCCSKIQTSESLPEGWHHFNSHHQAWGEDSIDSFEHYDVCSVGCYLKTISKLIEENGHFFGFEVNGMKRKFAKKLVSAFNLDKNEE